MSNEYGWTTEYIMSRTMREIYWRLQRISERKDRDWRTWASLHGVKVPEKKINKVQKSELSEKQKAAIDRIHKQRIWKMNERAKEWHQTKS